MEAILCVLLNFTVYDSHETRFPSCRSREHNNEGSVMCVLWAGRSSHTNLTVPFLLTKKTTSRDPFTTHKRITPATQKPALHKISRTEREFLSTRLVNVRIHFFGPIYFILLFISVPAPSQRQIFFVLHISSISLYLSLVIPFKNLVS